jgi:signal transduction histidine kinase
MSGNRWWHVVVVGAVLLVGALVAVTATAEPWMTPAALTLLAAFAVFYAAVGRRGLDEERWRIPLAIALVVTIAVGTAFSPNMAVLQCIAFPLLWLLLPSPRMGRPIAACTVLSVGTAIGFFVCFGGGIDALMQAVVIEGVSLGLGVGIGVWFTRALRKGDENTRLLAELTAAQDQLAALHREAGAGAERERLARDLHDTIAQNLTSVVMLAQRGRNRADPAMQADFELIEEVAREALTETRSLVAASAPVPVDGGLVQALGRLVAAFERETRIRIATRFEEVGPLPRDHEVVLLRSAQEALANVRKHSRAEHARLTLVHAGSGAERRLVLTVQDDGRGIGDAAPASSGFGLEGMRQRLALVGGTLRVAGVVGGGTELVAAIAAGEPADGDRTDGDRTGRERADTDPVNTTRGTGGT